MSVDPILTHKNQFGFTSIDKQATLAINGKVLVTGPSVFLYILFKNSIGAGPGIYMQVHDLASGPPTAGARALGYTAGGATPNNGVGQLGTLGATFGFTCTNGILIVASSTQDTYTAISSTSVPYTALYLP